MRKQSHITDDIPGSMRSDLMQFCFSMAFPLGASCLGASPRHSDFLVTQPKCLTFLTFGRREEVSTGIC